MSAPKHPREASRLRGIRRGAFAMALACLIAGAAARTDAAPTPTAPYKRTILVSGAGAPAKNGAALRAALTSIDGANAANPWLVRLEPGTYDLGSQSRLALKSFVDLEGSGRGLTLLTSKVAAQPALWIAPGVTAELRDLSVQQITTDRSFGILVESSTGRLSRVDVLVRGLDCDGVVVSGASPRIEDVQLRVQATRFGNGVTVNDGSPTLHDIVATVIGPTAAIGIYVHGNGTGAGTVVNGFRATVQEDGNSQGARGARVVTGHLILRHAALDVIGHTVAGVLVEGGSILIEGSKVVTHATTAEAIGIFAIAGASRIEGSTVEGTTAVSALNSASVDLIRSRLAGNAISGPPSVLRCRGSYRTDLTPLGENCQ